MTDHYLYPMADGRDIEVTIELEIPRYDEVVIRTVDGSQPWTMLTHGGPIMTSRKMCRRGAIKPLEGGVLSATMTTPKGAENV